MKKRIAILVAITMLFGSINTISQKIQNNQIVQDSHGFRTRFFHPFVQTILLFIGQSLIYFFYKAQEKAKVQSVDATYQKYQQNQQISTITTSQPQKPDAPLQQVLIPTILDILSSIFSNFALNLIDGSIWQLTRGGQIITTAILSKILLKRIFTNQQIQGCLLAFIGITLVQVVSVITQNNTSKIKGNQSLLGIILLFIALICNSLSLIVQKNIFNKYSIQPLRIVYLQGFMGTSIMIVITFFFQYVSCPWSEPSQCVCLSQNQCYLQNYISFIVGMFHFGIFILILCYISTIVITTPIGAVLSKQVSPIARSMANISRIIIIWVFNIAITLSFPDDPQYQLESRNLWVNISKFVGFVLLGLGMITYISKKPILGILSKDDEQSKQQKKQFTMNQIKLKELQAEKI